VLVTTNTWREIELKHTWEKREREREREKGGGRENRVYAYAEIAYEFPTPPIRPVIDTPLQPAIFN